MYLCGLKYDDMASLGVKVLAIFGDIKGGLLQQNLRISRVGERLDELCG